MDECDDKYAAKLLEPIGNDLRALPIAVEFLITGRADIHLQSELDVDHALPLVEHWSLDMEKESDIPSDISSYLKKALPPLVRQFGIKDSD